jgi:hypothetical protein
MLRHDKPLSTYNLLVQKRLLREAILGAGEMCMNDIPKNPITQTKGEIIMTKSTTRHPHEMNNNAKGSYVRRRPEASKKLFLLRRAT